MYAGFLLRTYTINIDDKSCMYAHHGNHFLVQCLLTHFTFIFSSNDPFGWQFSLKALILRKISSHSFLPHVWSTQAVPEDSKHYRGIQYAQPQIQLILSAYNFHLFLQPCVASSLFFELGKIAGICCI
ncbi:hypothetical protein ACJX0J_017288 [Zea mays]